MRYNLISVLPGYPPRFGRQLFPRFGQFFQTRKMKLAETCRGGINFVWRVSEKAASAKKAVGEVLISVFFWPRRIEEWVLSIPLPCTSLLSVPCSILYQRYTPPRSVAMFRWRYCIGKRMMDYGAEGGLCGETIQVDAVFGLWWGMSTWNWYVSKQPCTNS